MISPISSTSFQSGLLSGLNKTTNAIGSNLSKLSSGFRITKASDDAAGLAIASKFDAEIKASKQAINNVSAGNALANVAEGGLNQISSLLTRAKELSVQAANSTLDNAARQALNEEFNSIKDEISRIGNVTEFNGQKLLNGELSSESANRVDIQAGTGSTPDDRINLNVVDDTRSANLGLDDIDITTQANAQNAIDSITSALNQVSSNKAGIGAISNRLSTASANLGVAVEHITAAATEIKGVDFAKEMTSLSQNMALQKANIQLIKQSSAFGKQLIGSLLDVFG